MNELSTVTATCSMCNKPLEGVQCDWPTYKKNLGQYVKYVIGYRCGSCGASFCHAGHRKELKFNIWSGFEKSPCPRCGTPLNAGYVLLKTVADKPKTTPRSLRQPVVFQTMLDTTLQKYQKNGKTALIIAVCSTAFIIVFSIIMGTLSKNSGQESSTLRGLYTIVGLVGFGLFAWPVCWSTRPHP